MVWLFPYFRLVIPFGDLVPIGDLFYGLRENSIVDLGSADEGSTTVATGEILSYKALSLPF